MSKKQKPSAPYKKQSSWAVPAVVLIVLVFGACVFLLTQRSAESPTVSSPVANTTATPLPAPTDSNTSQNPTEPLTMEVAKAVMVTAELEFPEGIPTIGAALSQIERRYKPDDGVGRTFAILDGYGQPTADGKLHLSMHVSSEKPGFGSLVFERTGEVLWNSKITQSSQPIPAKNLNVYLSDDAGGSWIIDGSGGPKSILDARVRDKGVPVRDFWPDGVQREATFVYSACGCPVKVMVRRVGERTTRTSDQPVIFPDDPGAVQTIARLMNW